MSGLPRARVCFEDTATLADDNPGCANAAAHTPSPVDYGGYFAWARRKTRTHVQRRCPTCELFVIWTPKVACSTCGRLIAPKADGTPRAHVLERSGGARCTPTKETVANAND